MPPLLTVGHRAPTPYIFNRLLVSVYSIEELCYLFKTNPFILDSGVLDRRLTAWLAEACGLPDLAKSLEIILKKSKSPEEFIMTILEYAGYLSPGEINRIADIFNGNIGLNDYEKEINRADFLLNSGKYQRARHEYDRILMNIPAGERLLSGRLYHNRGVTMARLFLFEQAAESFLKAYELSNSPESGRAYLASIRLNMDEVDYIRFISEHPSFHDFSLEVEHIYNQAMSVYNETDAKIELDELILDKAMGNGNSYNTGIEFMIKEAKKKYCNAVD
ncbi:MAG: hypothetical protein FWE14_04820 [Lachnospiraceae bacterium]|nr:hypothetical protein [Lachnospiraceae bacterium]